VPPQKLHMAAPEEEEAAGELEEAAPSGLTSAAAASPSPSSGLAGSSALDAVWYGAEGAALELGSQTTAPPFEGVSFLSGGGPVVVRARRVENERTRPPLPGASLWRGLLRGVSLALAYR